MGGGEGGRRFKNLHHLLIPLDVKWHQSRKCSHCGLHVSAGFWTAQTHTNTQMTEATTKKSTGQNYHVSVGIKQINDLFIVKLER